MRLQTPPAGTTVYCFNDHLDGSIDSSGAIIVLHLKVCYCNACDEEAIPRSKEANGRNIIVRGLCEWDGMGNFGVAVNFSIIERSFQQHRL